MTSSKSPTKPAKPPMRVITTFYPDGSAETTVENFTLMSLGKMHRQLMEAVKVYRRVRTKSGKTVKATETGNGGAAE